MICAKLQFIWACILREYFALNVHQSKTGKLNMFIHSLDSYEMRNVCRGPHIEELFFSKSEATIAFGVHAFVGFIPTYELKNVCGRPHIHYCIHTNTNCGFLV